MLPYTHCGVYTLGEKQPRQALECETALGAGPLDAVPPRIMPGDAACSGLREHNILRFEEIGVATAMGRPYPCRPMGPAIDQPPPSYQLPVVREQERLAALHGDASLDTPIVGFGTTFQVSLNLESCLRYRCPSEC